MPKKTFSLNKCKSKNEGQQFKKKTGKSFLGVRVVLLYFLPDLMKMSSFGYIYTVLLL